MLKDNIDKIHWEILSSNPSAIDILEKNPHKICWSQLSKNPTAINILYANPSKINGFHLCQNYVELQHMWYYDRLFEDFEEFMPLQSSCKLYKKKKPQHVKTKMNRELKQLLENLSEEENKYF